MMQCGGLHRTEVPALESSDPEIDKIDTLQKFLIDPNLTVCKFSVEETYFVGFIEKLFFSPEKKAIRMVMRMTCIMIDRLEREQKYGLKQQQQ